MMFLELLKKYKEQYGFKLYAFVLMPNHFHLLLELPPQKEEKYKGGLSEIMHDLNSSYTKYFNGKYVRKGHLFGERYKATLVEKEPYLSRITAYIHLNPKKKNLVSEVGQYPYSSYNFYIDKEFPIRDLIKEEKDEVLSLLVGQNYEQFIDKLIKERDSDLHKFLQRGVLGTEDFQEKAKHVLVAYQKEEKKQGLSFKKKLGIITLVIIGLGLGSVYMTRKIDMPLKTDYKLAIQIKKLLEDLENRYWQIRLVSSSAGPAQNDIIRFSGGKFSSGSFSQKGYPTSDYSLIIEDENKIIWETVQTAPLGIASWRGEIKNNQMRGILNLRYSDGKTQDFSFVGVNY